MEMINKIWAVAICGDRGDFYFFSSVYSRVWGVDIEFEGELSILHNFVLGFILW